MRRRIEMEPAGKEMGWLSDIETEILKDGVRKLKEGQGRFLRLILASMVLLPFPKIPVIP